MFGQLLTQIPRSVSITYAGQLSNLWCKSEEISRGTSMGISGFILGFCLGYIIPSAVIEDQNETLKSINTTENDVLNEFDSEKFKTQDGLLEAAINGYVTYRLLHFQLVPLSNTLES